ncbi:MAG TPA: diguanylate cyclase [Nitrosomonas sp.]|nr:diguanylate cyclase [Nitrosomonas sp.]HQX12760.1 diguanylate cyclase [Nitrosomonas sp.]HRB32886.1 diguanylate cyclase [Nitrosomonas sp.]HRB45370.1 diguanylate cyclase [Nitrosomonas sp.]HRB78366.1 diguanylate cyclase [Nitrosomonas sp.]
MNIINTTEFQEKIYALATSFVQQLPEKANEIDSLWHALEKHWNQDTLQNLHRLLHNLVDESKTFGHSELSLLSSSVEQLFKNALQTDVPPDGAHVKTIQQQLDELKQRLKQSTPIKTVEEYSKQADKVNSQASGTIFVVEDDVEAAQELALQLRYYGYEVEVFNHLEKFRAAIQSCAGEIVLMDVEFPEDEMGGIHFMEQAQRELKQQAKVIFISVHDTLSYRLGAIRAGGVAYFTKPINSAELIDQIDVMTASQVQEPFRILIVEDSSISMAYYSSVLEQAEMQIKSLEDPMKLLDVLNSFSPDLILMDLYLPGCNGIELSKVVRQIDGFQNIPIVHLVNANDLNTQSEVMSLRGSDFLLKPISPTQLVAAITSRVSRMRSLHSLMILDGPTGLLNHTAIKEELAREVIRSNRLNTPLSFATIDVDCFKKLNDNYGYAAGDRVVKSLARLLKQRLRETDVVGRYGGDEFSVILNDTDAASAAKVIDEIRSVFNRSMHLSQDDEFFVSFSCGIADLAHFSDVTGLTEAAERAMFQAKQRGRNKVVVNSGE